MAVRPSARGPRGPSAPRPRGPSRISREKILADLRLAARKGDRTALALALEQMRILAFSPRYWDRYLLLLRSPLARLVDLLVIRQGERVAQQKGGRAAAPSAVSSATSRAVSSATSRAQAAARPGREGRRPARAGKAAPPNAPDRKIGDLAGRGARPTRKSRSGSEQPSLFDGPSG